MLLISVPQLEAQSVSPSVEGDLERIQYAGLVKIKLCKMTEAQFRQFEPECNALLDRIMRSHPPQVKYRLANGNNTKNKKQKMFFMLLCYIIVYVCRLLVRRQVQVQDLHALDQLHSNSTEQRTGVSKVNNCRGTIIHSPNNRRATSFGLPLTISVYNRGQNPSDHIRQ